ncbi:CMRF35-like molecule 7 [Desmodus rotundus]|uniref:CMRF35-like molecule 7 n=1 Tax=Desmodus rotundus TaxID=9430 RepID=UPI002380F08E|nr:CMRF35-like molecule 7 [Desmodus rotundus]
MWLLPPLLLLFVPGCFSIYGPLSVRRSRGDSLTVQCHYDPGWETYHKWWCRGEAWGSCEILVKTAGSEQKVRSGRVSIQDHHWRNTFTVTIEELRESDTDAYWCGIERSGTDLGHQMHVVVDPAEPATTYPPVSVTPYPPAPVTSFTPASLASSPPIVQRSNSSDSSSSLTRSLLCNIHFVLLTFIKVLLLVGLLCAVMCLSRRPRDSQGDGLHLSGKTAAPLPPTPRLGPADPTDLISGNKHGSLFQKRQESPLGRGPPLSWPQEHSRYDSKPWPPAQEQRAEKRWCSPYTQGPRRHLQPQPCGSSCGPLSCDYAVALPDVGQ